MYVCQYLDSLLLYSLAIRWAVCPYYGLNMFYSGFDFEVNVYFEINHPIVVRWKGKLKILYRKYCFWQMWRHYFDDLGYHDIDFNVYI